MSDQFKRQVSAALSILVLEATSMAIADDEAIETCLSVAFWKWRLSLLQHDIYVLEVGQMVVKKLRALFPKWELSNCPPQFQYIENTINKDRVGARQHSPFFLEGN